MAHTDFATVHTQVLFHAWTGYLASTPIAGVKLFVEDHNANPPDSGPWGRVYVLPGDAFPYALGPDHRRGVGILWVQLFCPKGEGNRKAYQLSDGISNELDYEYRSSGGVRIQFNVTSISLVPSQDPAYQQFSIRLPFRWESDNTTTND